MLQNSNLIQTPKLEQDCSNCELAKQLLINLECNHKICYGCAFNTKIQITDKFGQIQQSIKCVKCLRQTNFYKLGELQKLNLEGINPEKDENLDNLIKQKILINKSISLNPISSPTSEDMNRQVNGSFRQQDSPTNKFLQVQLSQKKNIQFQDQNLQSIQFEDQRLDQQQYQRQLLHQQQQQQSSQQWKQQDSPKFQAPEKQEKKQSQVLQCPVHRQEYTLFDQENKEVLCIECVYGENSTKSQQNLIPIIKSNQIFQKEITNYQGELKKKLVSVEEQLKINQRNLILLQNSRYQSVQVINQEFQILLDEVQKRKKEIVKKIESQFDESLNQVTWNLGVLEEFRSLINSFPNMNPQIANANIPGNDQSKIKNIFIKFFISIQEMQKQMSFIPTNDKPQDIYDLPTVSFPNKQKLIKDISNYALLSNPPLANLTRQNNFSQNNNNNHFSIEIRSPFKSVPNLLHTYQSNYSSTQNLKLNQTKNSSKNNSLNKLKSQSPKPSRNQQSQSNQKISNSKQKLTNSQSFTSIIPEQNKKIIIQEIKQNRKNKIIQKSKSKTPPKNTQISTSILAMEFSSINSPFADSKILHNSTMRNKKSLEIILPEDQQSVSTKLLFRLSLHGNYHNGKCSQNFHKFCDQKAPYIVLIRANGFVFGYYMPIDFQSVDKYNLCQNCWIFSITNKYQLQPVRFPIKQNKKFIALYQSCQSPCLGSTLQQNEDLWIDLDCLQNSRSKLGYAYSLEMFPENQRKNPEEILAGQYTDWNVEEIEVYHLNI